MVSVSWKNWGNWPFKRGKMLKKRKKIRKQPGSKAISVEAEKFSWDWDWDWDQFLLVRP